MHLTRPLSVPRSTKPLDQSRSASFVAASKRSECRPSTSSSSRCSSACPGAVRTHSFFPVVSQWALPTTCANRAQKNNVVPATTYSSSLGDKTIENLLEYDDHDHHHLGAAEDANLTFPFPLELNDTDLLPIDGNDTDAGELVDDITASGFVPFPTESLHPISSHQQPELAHTDVDVVTSESGPLGRSDAVEPISKDETEGLTFSTASLPDGSSKAPLPQPNNAGAEK